MATGSIRSGTAPIDFTAVRRELGVAEEFPPGALREAEAVATGQPDAAVPSSSTGGGARRDDRDIPFVTIDPAGSRDLDQAVHIEDLGGDRYRVRYAIADVASFVAPGGDLDEATRRRGMTFYCPDLTVPLHPTVLGEGAASLLPGRDRRAVTWTIDIDGRGEPVSVDVRRSLVRSRQQLDYASVQAAADRGELPEPIALLPRVGRLRLQAARRRHAIDLGLPDAEVVRGPDGRWTLARRRTLPVEQYNAQISLLAGMCAAQLMLRGGVGIVRTLPPPDPTQVDQLRRSTALLGIEWPDDMPPGDVIAGLDAAVPRHAAFIEDAIRLLRGAGYRAFDGAAPQQAVHGGLAAPYAHITAPLRRLVDRFATEVCLALAADLPVPGWVTEALPTLPAVMDGAGRVARDVERQCAGQVSEFLLAERVGEVLTGVVVQLDQRRGRSTVLLDDPPVRVHAAADGLTEGSRAALRLTAVDRQEHRVDVAVIS